MQTYRASRHSVLLLHTHLVFVIKCQRKVLTDAMFTFCERTMGDVCTELDVELIEFNNEADHDYLLVVYTPTLHLVAGGTTQARRAAPGDQRDGLTPD